MDGRAFTHYHFGLIISPLKDLRAARRGRVYDPDKSELAAQLVALTAHAAKFREIGEPLMGREVAVPESLAKLSARDRVHRDRCRARRMGSDRCPVSVD